MTDIISQISGNQLVATIIICIFVFCFRILTDQWIERRSNFEAESKRRIKSNTKNALFFVLLVALVYVWAPSLRTFALSLTAFVVAIILATKELILCVSGYFLKSTSGLIRVGDWLSISGVRGEVVDQDIMTTTLEELGTGKNRYSYTGRSIVFPNSVFLNTSVKNERFNKRYTWHSISVVISPDLPVLKIRDQLVTRLLKEIEPFAEVARRYKALIEKRAGIELSKEVADHYIAFLDDTNIEISLSCFIPVNEAIRVENTIKDEALVLIEQFYSKR